MKLFTKHQDSFEVMHEKSVKKITVEAEKFSKKMIAFAFKAFKGDQVGASGDMDWNPDGDTVFILQADLPPLFQTQRKSMILPFLRKIFQAT